jgi:hypothetical protein
MPTLKGVTAIWYLSDLTLANTAGTAYASATGTFNFQSVSGSRTSDKSELKNKSGDVVGLGFTNDRHEGTFEGIPSGASGASAATVNILPAAGAKVIITDTVDAYLGQTWICESAEFKGDIGSPRTITIKLIRFSTASVADDAAA